MTKPMSKYEPREHVIDAELASGNLEAWKQVLGFSKPVAAPKCPSCNAVAENWWNYCAMCGWHIASGEKP